MHVSDSVLKKYDEVKIKEYIFGYIKEIQRHFDIPDDIMFEIIKNIYKQLCPLGFIQKRISMLKSLYKQIREKYESNSIR